MSSQVDGHDEERELRSFGYEQQLSRSMGVFSSLSISISCMCITAGIFTVYAYALSTADVGAGSAPERVNSSV